MNLHRYGEDFAAELEKARRKSKAMLATFIIVAELAMSLGGEASFEWPNFCVGWLLAELIAFIQRNDLYTTLVDGCRLGMTN